MQGTFKLPSGRKIRSQSQRRYVLVADGVGVFGDGKPYVVRRSDKVDTVWKARSRRDQVILDTVTGEVVS